jgi:hypothetical protein
MYCCIAIISYLVTLAIKTKYEDWWSGSSGRAAVQQVTVLEFKPQCQKSPKPKSNNNNKINHKLNMERKKKQGASGSHL